jgi:hypothetical protein
MKLLIPTITLAILSIACNNAKQKELSLKEKELELKERELKLKEDSTKAAEAKMSDYDVMKKWITESLGHHFTIDPESLDEAGFNTTNYRGKAYLSSPKYDEYLQPCSDRPTTKISSRIIEVDLSDDETHRFYFFTDDKFIRTYHLIAGANGGSTVYDLLTKKNTDYQYTFGDIKGNQASISRDGYDNQGHYWQAGRLDLSTGKITWGSIEH